MKILISISALVIFMLGCSKNGTLTLNNNNLINIDSSITTPTGLRGNTGYRLDTLIWNNNLGSNLIGYKIYRDTIASPSKLIATIPKGTNMYIDTGLGIYKKYYYAVSAYNAYKESPKSPVLSLITDTIKLGQTGGLHYVNFDFPTNTFTNLTHTITIKNLPTNWDGTLNNDGIYLQLYNAYINDTIQFYYGFQTELNGKKGFIFSRWSTRDLSNTQIAPGGWNESGGYEGNFVGVRKWYDWGRGTYTIALNLDSTDLVGDWYSVWVTNNQNNIRDYMGSLRFEKSSLGTGIKSGFGLWTELYGKNGQPNTPLPNWNISIDKVTADGNLPSHCWSQYSEDVYGSVRMPTNISSKNKIVYLDMGYDALRLNPKSELW
ncbi:MAG: fibronectin type III domain-containing protein [Bacteroidota bacterium]|nr:fibronectin type III domain-containing protein [Bacteroidota bacterium]